MPDITTFPQRRHVAAGIDRVGRPALAAVTAMPYVAPMRPLALLTAIAATACSTSTPGVEVSPDAPCASTASFAQRATAESGALAPVELARRWVDRCGRDEVVRLTQALVRHRTVGAEVPAAKNPEFQAMADALQAWSAEAGLEFAVIGEHDAWEVKLGQGARRLAFVMHADVVPVAEAPDGELPPGWSLPPFEGRVVDGRMVGRGSEDDKGPIAAALVALRTLRAFGVPTRGQLLVAIGTGEESDWDGMKRYSQAQPHARYIVSVDANFPVVIAESGFVAWRLRMPRADTPVEAAGYEITALRGGEFLTQVPGDATVVLRPGAGGSAAELLTACQQAAEAEQTARGGDFRIDVEATGEALVTVAVEGTAVHSSTADEGHNALWALASLAGRLPLAPGPEEVALRLLRLRFADDHWGERLGLSHDHPLMGRLLVAPTVLRSSDSGVDLAVNMRRPAGRTKEAFEASLTAALRRLQTDIDPSIDEAPGRYVGKPAIAQQDGELVDTLLAIYRQHTGDTASAPISIRGGTYARLFPGAVSFGPAHPGEPYTGHTPNESIDVARLHQLTRMLLDVAVRLDALADD